MGPGGTENIEVDIRVISTALDDLSQKVENGEFRRDLFHLLNTITVKIPALRERKQDIPELFSYFLKKYCEENDVEEPAVQSEIFESILEYDWKGNIRELENTVQNLLVMSPEGELLRSVLLPVNDEVINLEKPGLIKDCDNISIFPAMAGG